MDTVAFWPSFIRMLMALTLVLGLLVGAMFLLGRLMQRTSAGRMENGAINIVAARYLSPKSSIMVVEVLDNYMVIGLAGNQMIRLGSISNQEAIDKLKSVRQAGVKYPPWADYLKNQRLVRGLCERWGRDRGEK